MLARKGCHSGLSLAWPARLAPRRVSRWRSAQVVVASSTGVTAITAAISTAAPLGNWATQTAERACVDDLRMGYVTPQGLAADYGLPGARIARLAAAAALRP